MRFHGENDDYECINCGSTENLRDTEIAVHRFKEDGLGNHSLEISANDDELLCLNCTSEMYEQFFGYALEESAAESTED